MITTIQGDLIELAQKGTFDIIGHGCNCFCTMGSGIAPQIKTAFPKAYAADCVTVKGDRNKLGTYTFAEYDSVTVLNCYTQYAYGTDKRHVSYDAISDCMNKINSDFKGKHIGLPLIGAGLAGGNWNIIRTIIQEELKDLEITIVEWSKK